MHKLKGVVFDYACGLDQYILNREPREFEYLRFGWSKLAGCYYSIVFFIFSKCKRQKKLNQPDRSGHGGHIGSLAVMMGTITICINPFFHTSSQTVK